MTVSAYVGLARANLLQKVEKVLGTDYRVPITGYGLYLTKKMVEVCS